MTTPTQQATPPPQTPQKSQLLSPEEVVRIVWSKHDQAENFLHEEIRRAEKETEARSEVEKIKQIVQFASQYFQSAGQVAQEADQLAKQVSRQIVQSNQIAQDVNQVAQNVKQQAEGVKSIADATAKIAQKMLSLWPTILLVEDKRYIEAVITISNTRLHNLKNMREQFEKYCKENEWMHVANEESKKSSLAFGSKLNLLNFLPLALLGFSLGFILARITRILIALLASQSTIPFFQILDQHQYRLAGWVGLAFAMLLCYIRFLDIEKGLNKTDDNWKASYDLYLDKVANELNSLYKEVNQAHKKVFGQVHTDEDATEMIESLLANLRGTF